MPEGESVFHDGGAGGQNFVAGFAGMPWLSLPSHSPASRLQLLESGGGMRAGPQRRSDGCGH